MFLKKSVCIGVHPWFLKTLRLGGGARDFFPNGNASAHLFNALFFLKIKKTFPQEKPDGNAFFKR